MINNKTYKTLFALDTSASTSSIASYWNRVNDVYMKYKGPDTLYVAWDAKAQILTEKQVVMEIKKKCTINGGDTRPDILAKKIQELNFKGDLVLITDGQISAANVSKTDTELVNWEFSSVDIELIGSRIDLSVTAPFTRKTKFTIQHNGNSLSKGASNMVIDLEDYSTVEKFQSGYENLYGVVVSQNMGKFNEGLRDGFLQLQKKLLMEIAIQNKTDCVGTPVLESLRRGDYNAAVSLTKVITIVALDNDLPKEISDKIQKLVKACTNPGVYSLDILSNARVQRADNTKQVESEQIEVLDNTDEKFECPIYYEQDIPALLIAKGKNPILDGETKEIVDLLCNCPLYLLNFPHLVQKVQNLIDHPIGCQSIAIKNGVFEDSPMTRAPILGAIPMGSDKSHVKAGNWTISRLFTGGKMIGNIQLWYIVLYNIAKKVGYLSDNKELMESMKQHLKYRLENFSSYMGLSGLPEYPLIKVPVSQAIWYCVSSADFYCEDKVDQDRLRSFISIHSILTGVLDELNYPYNKEFTAQRVQIFTALNYMMSLKFDTTKLEQILRAQHQNHLYLKSLDQYVFLDGTLAQGHATAPALPEQLTTLPLSQLLFIFSKVSTQVKANQIVMPRNLPEFPIPNAKYHYMYAPDTINYSVVICPATSRPYVNDQTKKVTWETSCQEIYGSLDKVISLNRHYLAYMQFKNQFPELEDFLLFVYQKESQSQRKRDTLPINILKTYVSIHHHFKEAFEKLEAHLGRKITAQDVVTRGNSAANKVQRHQIELKWLNGTYEK